MSEMTETEKKMARQYLGEVCKECGYAKWQMGHWAICLKNGGRDVE